MSRWTENGTKTSAFCTQQGLKCPNSFANVHYLVSSEYNADLKPPYWYTNVDHTPDCRNETCSTPQILQRTFPHDSKQLDLSACHDSVDIGVARDQPAGRALSIQKIPKNVGPFREGARERRHEARGRQEISTLEQASAAMLTFGPHQAQRRIAPVNFPVRSDWGLHMRLFPAT
jgi:hypothetical protein